MVGAIWRHSPTIYGITRPLCAGQTQSRPTARKIADDSGAQTDASTRTLNLLKRKVDFALTPRPARREKARDIVDFTPVPAAAVQRRLIAQAPGEMLKLFKLGI